jgi:uncharacterized protein
MRGLSVRAIAFYRRRLSPHKGFCCAYRTLTGRHSCSHFASRAIERVGLIKGVCLTLRRFRRCSAACAANRERHLPAMRLQRGHCDCDLGVADCHGAHCDRADFLDCLPCDGCDPWDRRRTSPKREGRRREKRH